MGPAYSENKGINVFFIKRVHIELKRDMALFIISTVQC